MKLRNCTWICCPLLVEEGSHTCIMMFELSRARQSSCASPYKCVRHKKMYFFSSLIVYKYKDSFSVVALNAPPIRA